MLGFIILTIIIGLGSMIVLGLADAIQKETTVNIVFASWIIFCFFMICIFIKGLTNITSQKPSNIYEVNPIIVNRLPICTIDDKVINLNNHFNVILSESDTIIVKEWDNYVYFIFPMYPQTETFELK